VVAFKVFKVFCFLQSKNKLWFLLNFISNYLFAILFDVVSFYCLGGIIINIFVVPGKYSFKSKAKLVFAANTRVC